MSMGGAKRPSEASHRPLLIDVTETTSVRSDLDPGDALELRSIEELFGDPDAPTARLLGL